MIATTAVQNAPAANNCPLKTK